MKTRSSGKLVETAGWSPSKRKRKKKTEAKVKKRGSKSHWWPGKLKEVEGVEMPDTTFLEELEARPGKLSAKDIDDYFYEKKQRKRKTKTTGAKVKRGGKSHWWPEELKVVAGAEMPDMTFLKQLQAKPGRLSAKDIDEVFYEDKDRHYKTDWYPIYGDRPGSFQMDLMYQTPKIRGFWPVLTLIHINRKVATAVPFRKKTAKNTATALATAINQMENKYKLPVRQITTDAGSEFKGAVKTLCINRGITLHVCEPTEGHKTRMAIVERFHRTIKDGIVTGKKMYGTGDWPRLIPYILYNYNYVNKHKSIKKTPMETTQEDEDDYVEKRKRKTERLKQLYSEQLEEHMNAGRDWVRHYLLQDKKEFKQPKAQYTTTKYAAEPIEGERGYELYEHRTDDKPLRKKYMPYHLMWTD
jgi:hypothetical protein